MVDNFLRRLLGPPQPPSGVEGAMSATASAESARGEKRSQDASAEGDARAHASATSLVRVEEDEVDNRGGEEESEGEEESVEIRSRRSRRETFRSTLIETLANCPTDRVHEHQRALSILVVERFCRGDPGALLSLDTGLGKTFVSFLLAGAFIASNIRVVMATEPLLAKELEHRFKTMWRDSTLDFSKLTILVSGNQETHAEAVRMALNGDPRGVNEQDVVFFIDEAMRYDAANSAFHRALLGRDVFRIAMSATPFTSNVSQIIGMSRLCGFECPFNFAAVASTWLEKNLAFGDECETIQKWIDTWTVGKRSLEARFPEVARDLEARLARVHLDVNVMTLHQSYDALPNDLEGASFREIIGDESCIGADGSLLDIVHGMVAANLKEGAKTVIFVPSCVARVATIAWAHLRSKLAPDRVGLINKDTLPEARHALIADFNKGDLVALFVTSETGGFGIDLTSCLRCVLLSAPWTGATMIQCVGRILRVFSQDALPGTRVVTLLQPLLGSVALVRICRALIRGKFGELCFPGFLSSRLDSLDFSSVNANLATFDTMLKENERCDFAERFRERVAASFAHGELMTMKRFVETINEVFATSSFVAPFIIHENGSWIPNEQVVDAPRHARVRNAQPRSNDGELRYVSLRQLTRVEQAVLIYARSRRVLSLSDEETTRGRAVALEIFDAIGRARIRLENGHTWRPSESVAYAYLCPKTTEPTSAIRRGMVCASALSQGRIFATRVTRVTAIMNAGIQLEARALQFVADKYNLKMVDGVDNWTRFLPSHPTLLCATPDGLTTDGVLVELKFVHRFRKIFSHFECVEYFMKYRDQVQAQLAVFNLDIALLVFYTINGDDDEMVSLEFEIRKDPAWLTSNLRRFEEAVRRQRDRDENWDDELL